MRPADIHHRSENMATAGRWFYKIMGEEVGPITGAALKSLADDGTIERDTPIRRVDRDGWCLYNQGMDTTRGRPSRPDDDRRDIRFQIRLSAAELELIEQAADGKPSTWSRDVLLKAARPSQPSGEKGNRTQSAR